MNYSIIHVDSKKYPIVAGLKKVFRSWDYIDIDFKRHTEEELISDLKKFNIQYDPSCYCTDNGTSFQPATRGEVSLWINTIKCLDWSIRNSASIFVFEDDCFCPPGSNKIIESIISEAPKHDFLSFHSRTHLEKGVLDFTEGEFKYNEEWNKPFCNTSCMAMLYSPEGSEKILQSLRETGITNPMDNYFFCSYRKKFQGFVIRDDKTFGIKENFPRSKTSTGPRNSPFFHESYIK